MGTFVAALRCFVIAFVVIVVGGDVDFDPRRDLAGFRDIDEVKLEYQILFEAERFEALKGKRTEEDVARIRSEWEQVRSNALARLAKIESDPNAAAVFAFDKALRIEIVKHFPKGKFESATIPPALAPEGRTAPDPPRLGLEIRYQVPKSPEKFYGDAIGKNYGLLTHALFRHFEAEFAEPLALARRPDYRPFVALVVLEDRAAYESLFVKKTHADPTFVRAHYDPLRRLAFSYEPGSAELTREKQQAVLHEMTHALLDAYGPPGGQRLPVWLNEGFAEYLSHGHGHVSSSNFPFGVKPERALLELENVFEVDDSPYVYAIEDLFRIASYADAAPILTARAAEKGAEIDPSLALALLYKQSHVLVWWLDRHGGPELRQSFRKYLAAELKGAGGIEAFRAAFGVEDCTELDRRFVAAVREIPRSASDAIEAEAPVAKAVESKYRSIAFVLQPASRSAERGAVFARARRGEFALASSDARDKKLDAADLEFVSRLETDVDRILTGLAAKAVTIAVRIGERADGSAENVQGKVLRHDREKIVLLRGTTKQEHVVDRSLYGLSEAIQHAAKAGYDLSKLDRGRVLGLLGTKDPKVLAALGLKVNDLKNHESARADIHAALVAAEVRAELEALASFANSPTGENAGVVVKRIEDLLRANGAFEEVVRHRVALRDLAGQCLERAMAEGTRSPRPWNGKLTVLDDGRIELRYSFDAVEELEDFEPVDIRPGWLGDRPKIPPSKPTPVDGTASMRGYSALTHTARFAGDFELEYEFLVNTNASAVFATYFGDLDAARFAYIPFSSDIVVFTSPSATISKPLAPIEELVLQKNEKVHVEQKGQRIRASSRGRAAEIDRGLRDSNRLLFLTLNSVAEMRIDSVVLRGRFDPKWMSKISATAIETELNRLFPG